MEKERMAKKKGSFTSYIYDFLENWHYLFGLIKKTALC